MRENLTYGSMRGRQKPSSAGRCRSTLPPDLHPSRTTPPRSGSEFLSQVGFAKLSLDPMKPAHSVPVYMLYHDYDVIPVNPEADEILGRKCYASLSDVPGDIGILNVFRPSDQVVPVVEEALQRRKERGDVHVIWLQKGIRNARARAMAEEAGVVYVEDRCVMVEHMRMVR